VDKEQAPRFLHRKQKTWQIFVPLGLFLAGILALAVWAAVATAGNPVTGMEWAAVSIVFLSLPALLIMMIMLIVLISLIYLQSKLLGILPYYGLKARTIVYQVGSAILQISNKAVKPVMAVNGLIAGWLTLLERLHLRKSG